MTGARDGPDSAENREVFPLFLDLVPRCCATTGAGCRDSAENCGVSAVGAALGQGC